MKKYVRSDFKESVSTHKIFTLDELKRFIKKEVSKLKEKTYSGEPTHVASNIGFAYTSVEDDDLHGASYEYLLKELNESINDRRYTKEDFLDGLEFIYEYVDEYRDHIPAYFNEDDKLSYDESKQKMIDDLDLHQMKVHEEYEW